LAERELVGLQSKQFRHGWLIGRRDESHVAGANLRVARLQRGRVEEGRCADRGPENKNLVSARHDRVTPSKISAPDIGPAAPHMQYSWRQAKATNRFRRVESSVWAIWMR